MASGNNNEEGRYLYCIVNSGKETDFGQMGIEDNIVYTVPLNDIGAVVHRCEAKPYRTEDAKKAQEWILAHQYIVDLTTEEFGTVIPLTFDTILKGGDDKVKQWLREEYNQLKTQLEKLEGKSEYGIQIFLDKDLIKKTVEENEEIQSLRRELERKSEGVAYLFRKKLEKRLEQEKRMFIENHAKTLYNEIKRLVDDVRLESVNREVPEKWKDKQMILNLACLVHKYDVQHLGKMLGEINKKEGFVWFTGPWPPYSFVGDIMSQKAR
jgi:bisphosphoglycerate-dependent phosphoglycerate mutase